MSYLIFVKCYYRIVINRLKSVHGIKMREALVTLFLCGYFISCFLFFYWALMYVHSFPVVGDLVLERMWRFFFFILFVMLIFSNCIVSVSSHYQSREVAFLLRYPLSPALIFMKQLGEGTVFSSWGFLFLASPLMIAYGLAMKVSIYYYLAIIPSLLAFIAIAAVLGSLITLILFSLPPIIRRGFFWVFGGILFPLFVVYLLRFPITLQGSSDEQLFLFLQNFLGGMKFIENLYLPSAWIAIGLDRIGSFSISEGAYFILLLIITSLIFLDLCYWISANLYFRAWSNRQGQVSRLRKFRRYFKNRFFEGWILNRAGLSLLKKDLLLFVRDTQQWIQFVVMGALMLLYIVNLRNMSSFIDSLFWENIIFFSNVTAIGLTIATLAIRFAYPQFSLEGRRRWILGMSPIGLQYTLKIKFYFSFCLCFIFSQVLAFLSFWVLGVSWWRILLASYVITMMNIALISLALCLGIIYQNTASENLAKIMSGVGGILTLLFSMTYILLIKVPLSLPFHLIAIGKWTYNMSSMTIIFFVLLWVTCLSLAVKRLSFHYALTQKSKRSLGDQNREIENSIM